MAIVVPDVGERTFLSYIVNKAIPTDLKLHIYTNDYTPTESSTVANFTECSASGYTPVTLTGANWTISTDAGGNSTATYPQITFTFTSGSTNYGYYVTDSTGTILLWAERFNDAPHTLPSGGGTEKITLVVQLD
jgi:hypothetical protein